MGFEPELDNGSFGYGKQCVLWTCERVVRLEWGISL